MLGGLALGLGSPPAGVYVSEVRTLYCTVLYCTVLYCTVGEKYHGTPLELGDARLGEVAAWLQTHNITVVKLDCRTRVGFQVKSG